MSNESGWWAQEVGFSDWRDKKCDYSTNAIVDWWYNGKGSKYFRHENMIEISERLLKGDTLRIGLDYYSLFPISGTYIPEEKILEKYYEFVSGGVVVYRVYLFNDKLIWVKQ